jgi:hypothetical protein
LVGCFPYRRNRDAYKAFPILDKAGFFVVIHYTK